MTESRPVLFWGFQGTLDHRASLTADQFHALQLEPPQEDQERFISKRELVEALEQIQRLSIPHATAPGGSPLISALTAGDWYRGAGAEAVARFIGARPDGLRSYVDGVSQDTLQLSESNPVIGGTLALEYRPANSKIMLSVPDGRWLDDGLAARALDAIGGGVLSLRPKRIGVGIGGLNKASLHAVQQLIQEIRRLPVPAVIFATGSSFRKDIGTERPVDYWDQLLEIFSSVDVVSVSSAEYRQLEAVYDEDWGLKALDGGTLKFLIRHSSGDALTYRSEIASAYLESIEAIVETARAEASQHAQQALTGLGARLDGVLSAAVLLNWERVSE
jgi:hypothetical protein